MMWIYLLGYCPWFLAGIGVGVLARRDHILREKMGDDYEESIAGRFYNLAYKLNECINELFKVW